MEAKSNVILPPMFPHWEKSCSTPAYIILRNRLNLLDGTTKTGGFHHENRQHIETKIIFVLKFA